MQKTVVEDLTIIYIIIQSCISPGSVEMAADPRLKQSPVVIVTDCLKDNNNLWNKLSSFRKRKKFGSNEELSGELEVNIFLEQSMNGILTPSKSSVCGDSEESSEVSTERKVKKRKARKKQEYEVEKVVGYHLDKNKKMWYLLKWKGYRSKYNSFQTLEDMGNCNKLLMQYFEYKKPNQSQFDKMDKEVEESVLNSNLYKTLIRTNFRKAEFLRFMSFPTVDLSLIFTDNYEKIHNMLKSEYQYIVRCLIGMCYHRDQGMFERAEQYKLGLMICKMREIQLNRLKEQEDSINALETCMVRVINNRDLDVLPEGLEYLTELKPGNGVRIPRDPPAGCNCLEGCSPRSNCCGAMMDTGFAYTKDRKLKWFRVPIYECNIRCECSLDCPNRVVQRGRNIPVAIFKTEHCGWGVKTLQEIQKGSFVCEYLGEVISEDESLVRDVEYVPKNMNFVFNLDFTPDRNTMYCIDATHGGNFSRYINHSCEPNLIVSAVWINCLDPNMPQLAFFARRHIRKGEELSIDYESRVDIPPTEINTDESTAPRIISNKKCYCKKEKCRQWLFGSL